MNGGLIFLIVVLCLVVVGGTLYYIASRYEDPPLWWPNWMRPGWDKDPDEFTDVSQIQEGDEESQAFKGVGVGGAKGAGKKYAE